MTPQEKTMENLNQRCIAELGINARQARQFIWAKSAIAARQIWDYRAAGHTRRQAETLVRGILGRYTQYPRNYPETTKQNYQHRYTRPATPRIDAYRERKYQRARNAEQIGSCGMPKTYSDIDWYLRGYESGHYSARITLADGRIFVLRRNEDVQWDDSRKRNRWPTRTEVSYTATLYTPEYDQVSRCNFSRRGDWMAKVAAELGLPQSPKSAITLTSANIFPSNEEREINCVHIHALAPFGAAKIRLYCASYAGKTYHADTPREAVQGLREKIEADKPLAETRIITRAHTRQLHFCQAGVEQFLLDIGLDPETESIDRRKLQAIVSRMDASAYKSELEQLGITVAGE